MMINAEVFFKNAFEVLDKVKNTQLEKIKEASAILADAIANDGVVHIFGTGHSKAFAMELANRAGGLVPMHRVTLDDLSLRGILPSEDLLDPQIERDPTNAHKLWELYDIRPQDAFIIVSNSGRNGTIVEFASMVKDKKMPLIVVTSLEHSQSTTSRHSSGKMLYEFGDVIIDNCGPEGDALIPVEGLSMKACSISSVTGACIAQGITAEIINILKGKGIVPPVLISANVDGGDKHNDDLRAKYEGRI